MAPNCFFAKSQGRTCQNPYQAKQQDQGGLTASTAPFFTNPIDAAHSHSRRRTSGGRRLSVPTPKPWPYALFHCGGREIGCSAMFLGLRAFLRPLSPCLNAIYCSRIHIQAVGARRWSVIHLKPRPEPDFFVARLNIRPRQVFGPPGLLRSLFTLPTCSHSHIRSLEAERLAFLHSKPHQGARFHVWGREIGLRIRAVAPR